MAKNSKPKSSVEVITPAKAKKFLAVNDNNRPIARSRVKKFQLAMEQNRWVLNGESIKVATTGQLLDGQHRLEACVAAGKPFETLVIYGLKPNAYETIDVGKPRSLADTLAVMNLKYYVAMATAIKVAYWIPRGNLQTNMSAITTDQFLKFLKRNPQIKASVMWCSKMPNWKVIGHGFAGGFHYVFKQKNQRQADKFITGLLTGADLPKKSNVLKLRNKLIEARAQKGITFHYTEQNAYIVKAWNAERTGGDVNFTLRKEDQKGFTIK